MNERDISLIKPLLIVSWINYHFMKTLCLLYHYVKDIFIVFKKVVIKMYAYF